MSESRFEAANIYFLEELQAAIYGCEAKPLSTEERSEIRRRLVQQNGDSPPEVSVESFQHMLEQCNQDSEKRWRPTLYESPETYATLMELAAAVAPQVSARAQLPYAPLVGSAPYGRPGADLIPVRNSDHCIVLVDNQFPTLANLVAKALAQAVTVRGEAPDRAPELYGTTRRLTPSHPAVARFVEVMITTQLRGPSSAVPYWPSSEWVKLSGALRDAIEWFELAHPFAHLAAGHDRRAARRPWLEGLGDYERFEWDYDEEIEAFATSLGAVFACAARKHGDIRFAGWAIDAWLATKVVIAGGVTIVHGESTEAYDEITEGPRQRRECYRRWLASQPDELGVLETVILLEPVVDQLCTLATEALRLVGDTRSQRAS